MSRALRGLFAVLFLLSSAGAEASPSRWARARDPEIDRRATLLADAEALALKFRHSVDTAKFEDGQGDAQMYLQKARDLLEQGGAARSRDPVLRYRLAEIYNLLQDDEKAVPLFKALLRDNPPAPVRADAYSSLAISYARLGQHEEEIKAYGQALLLEPHTRQRARLLANRAEAYMAIGEITPAVEGYRAALSLLSSVDMIFGLGPTTLWGLAVALDRTGDLDSGLDAVRLARTYDPADKRINGPGWFYVPPYDKYYYQALGHWSAARAAELNAAKAEGYSRAIAAWEEYIASAAPEDRWLALARARLRQCEKEREAWLRALRRKVGAPSEAPTGPRWRSTPPRWPK
jgi:tetratricopeptide (TPR) repeat protein